MGAYGRAAAHVADDEVEFVVVFADFFGIAAGDGFLIEGVEGGDAGQLGETGDAGVGHVLVDGDGVGDVGFDAGFDGNLVGDESAQVRGVLALCVGEVAAQVFVDLVCAGLDGVNEAAASHDGIQRLDGYIIVLQRFQHKLEAPGKLLGGVVEGLELVGRVLDGGGENGCLVFVNGNLCGS